MIIGNIAEAVRSGAKWSTACKTIGLSLRTIQRWKLRPEGGEDLRQGPRDNPGNRLGEDERAEVLRIANSPTFRDLSPNQIVPTLADQNIYVASESTFYRILKDAKLDAHRSASTPPRRKKPREQVAEAPNRVWTWDITYLKGPVKGTFFYLYLVVDIFSRKIVGRCVRETESSEYAALLVDEACQREGIRKDTLILHQDNGSPMKGATLKATLEKLGVIPSYSRPHVSDDNPYSESLFRTMKYRPEYPTKAFLSLEAAEEWVAGFVRWYNTQHLHSSIRFITPEQRHEGLDEEILNNRRKVYEQAREKHPERWSGKTRNWDPIKAVYLSPEEPENFVTAKRHLHRKAG
jgi:putative transposase